MEKRKINGQGRRSSPDAEKAVENYYEQLVAWAQVLTRGDLARAQDIVQELCLHFALAKPDLSAVEKLEGYLYTCLKNIYLSMLARASREAMHVVSLEDFDSIEFAIQSGAARDIIQKQNDLRRICAYSVWRKEQSKNFCYFILHFFHGYYRHEVSSVARVPMAVLYNKLKAARDEIKVYLAGTGKVHLAAKDSCPEPSLLWAAISTSELFRELRANILSARSSDCLPEAVLLGYYAEEYKGTIPGPILAHIVSCERCLSLLDAQSGRPLLREREPLDALGYFGENRNGESSKGKQLDFQASLRVVARRRMRFYEHRPAVLCIAVNGKILAFHEVRAERSILTARTEKTEDASFVEVFSEQDVRLAFLPIIDVPPEGPHVQSQVVALSDGRWLRLSLSFEGQGLYSEVTYFDPVLATANTVAAEEESSALALSSEAPYVSRSERNSFREKIRRLKEGFQDLLDPLIARPVMAWSVLLLVVTFVGYLAYRQVGEPLTASQVLNRSVEVARSESTGRTIHQVMRYEERSEAGKTVLSGTIDLWRDGDGSRSMRKLYDSGHRFVASEWQLSNGKLRTYLSPENSVNQELMADDLWKMEVSPQAFVPADHQKLKLRRTSEGYELSVVGALMGRPQVLSATLAVDAQWRFVRQILHVRKKGEIREICYEQMSEEHKQMREVPDSFFESEAVRTTPSERAEFLQAPSASREPDPSGRAAIGDQELAELQLAVLYQLFQMDIDGSEPVDVVRTPRGRIALIGAIGEEKRRKELLLRLEGLQSRQYIDVQLASPRDGTVTSHNRRSTRQRLEVFEIGQKAPLADEMVRKAFASRRLNGEALDLAVVNFSREVLTCSQRALQEANSLYRLGSAFSPQELQGLSPLAREHWLEMVEKHGNALSHQFEALRERLDVLSAQVPLPTANAHLPSSIETPEGYAKNAESLLHQTQNLNREIGRLFASSSAHIELEDANGLLSKAKSHVPQRDAEAMVFFARKMQR